MSNKKLIKFVKEIEKLDFKYLSHISDLNKFQFDVLLFLRKKKKCATGLIVKKINRKFSRAQKYRLIDDLISKRICRKNKQYISLNL